MPAAVPITIRPIESRDDFGAVERLQAEVWGLPDVEVVPLHVLVTAARNGGLLLGAWDDSSLVGFVFGFPGLTPEGQLKHCSHMAGVHPDHRDRGIGYRLKLAQREAVLAQGIALITWTFDPLETRNAALNFHKLGTTCRTYLRNLYGNMRDGLNAGLPSDRFQVDWWIASPRVQARLKGEIDPQLADLQVAGVPALDPLPAGRHDVPPGRMPPLEESQLLMRVPMDFQAIKAANLDLARAWRSNSRAWLEAAFAEDYAVTDLLTDGSDAFYLLER